MGVSGVTIDGVTVDGSNPNLTHLDAQTTDDASEGIVSYTGVGNITVKNNIIENTAYTGVDFYNYNNNGAPTANNVITDNLIQNLSDAFGFGIGVNLYNNFYAQVTHNVMNDVTVGVQTGNFSQANSDNTFTPEISNNTIAASGVGIFYNLMYDGSSTITVSDNTITAIYSVTDAPWQGVLLTFHPGPGQRLVPDQHDRRFTRLYIQRGSLVRIRNLEYAHHQQRADLRRFGYRRGLRRVGKHLRRLQQRRPIHPGDDQRREHQRQPDRRLRRR